MLFPALYGAGFVCSLSQAVACKAQALANLTVLGGVVMGGNNSQEYRKDII